MTRPILLILLVVGGLLLGGWLVAPTLFAAGITLTVTGYGDFNDLNPGDGICDTNSILPGDQCSLRAAIEELNALGPDITVPARIRGQPQPGAACPTSNGRYQQLSSGVRKFVHI